jgi:putative transposase
MDAYKRQLNNLPMFGKVKVVLHQSLSLRLNCILLPKADGFYVTLSLEDQTVPEIKPDFNPDKITGIDVGLKEFLTTSCGFNVAIPQHYPAQSSKTFTGNSKNVSRRKRNRRQKAG